MMQLIRETELDTEMLRRILKTEIEGGQIDVESDRGLLLLDSRARFL